MADNNEIIKCPACGCDMEKVFMPSSGINLDVCTKGCGGIYFDNRELKAFDEHNEDISPLEELFKNKKFKHVDETETRYCPICGSTMVKNYASPKKEIQIDECYNCGGKFLDHGELNKIRDEYNSIEEKNKDGNKEFYTNYINENIEPDSKEKFYKELNSKGSDEMNKHIENINLYDIQKRLPYNKRISYKKLSSFIDYIIFNLNSK